MNCQLFCRDRDSMKKQQIHKKNQNTCITKDARVISIDTNRTTKQHARGFHSNTLASLSPSHIGRTPETTKHIFPVFEFSTKGGGHSSCWSLDPHLFFVRNTIILFVCLIGSEYTIIILIVRPKERRQAEHVFII